MELLEGFVVAGLLEKLHALGVSARRRDAAAANQEGHRSDQDESQTKKIAWRLCLCERETSSHGLKRIPADNRRGLQMNIATSFTPRYCGNAGRRIAFRGEMLAAIREARSWREYPEFLGLQEQFPTFSCKCWQC